MNYLSRVAITERPDGILITRFSKFDMVNYGFCETSYDEKGRKNVALALKLKRAKLEELPISFTSQNEDEFMTWQMNRIAPGQEFTVISEDDIPKRQDGQWDKSERKEWSLNKVSKRVFVDPAKRAAKQAREGQKQALLAKLGITKEEVELLRKV